MVLTEFPNRYCPACSTVVSREFKPGPGGRPDASCPACGSLERHRFIAVLLACLQPTLGKLELLLDVAPTTQVTPLLRRLNPQHLVRFDIGADNRNVDVVGSLTDVPLADNSVDLLTCYHVLEHIPDDRAAMREIARIMRPGGLALLQVPFRAGTVTDEDPSAPEDVRIARFGQADHVRYYGDDFEDRLIESGLALRRVTPRSLLGDEMCAWFKLMPNELVWLATPSADPAPTVPVTGAATSLTRALDDLLDQLAQEHRRAEDEHRRAEEAQRRADTERAAANAAKATTKLKQPLRQLALLAPESVRKSDSKVVRALRRRLR